MEGKKLLLLLLLCLFFTEVWADKVRVYVLGSKETRISFANVAVRDFMWATCSNEEGYFEVDEELLCSGVVFDITHLGYASCRMTGDEISRNGNKVQLSFQSVELNEIMILPEKVMRKKGKEIWQKILKNWDKNQLHESYVLNVHNLISENENDTLIYFHESNGQIFRLGYTPQLCHILSGSYRSGNDFLRLFRVRESVPARKGNYLFLISDYPYHFMVQEYFVINKMNPEIIYWEENSGSYYLEVKYDLGFGDSGQLKVWADKDDYCIREVEKTEHVVIEQDRKIDALTHERWKYGKRDGGIYPTSYSGDLIRYQRTSDGREWIANRLQRADFTNCNLATDQDYEIFVPGWKGNKPDYRQFLVKDYSFWSVAAYRKEDWKQVSVSVGSAFDRSRLEREFQMNYQFRWQYETSSEE